jgi:hypothetical protein
MKTGSENLTPAGEPNSTVKTSDVMGLLESLLEQAKEVFADMGEHATAEEALEAALRGVTDLADPSRPQPLSLRQPR